MTKRNKIETKKSKKAIVWSILFTLFIPIGFVYLMGFLSESMSVLYFYTKQIFVIFLILIMVGLALIGYHSYCYFKVDVIKPRKKLQKNVPVDNDTSIYWDESTIG